MDKYLTAAQQTSLTLARPAHTAGMTWQGEECVHVISVTAQQLDVSQTEQEIVTPAYLVQLV